MSTTTAAPLFPPGRLVATPGARDLLICAGVNPVELLARHQAGDWGNVPPEDARENAYSLKYGFRVISSYSVADEGVWVITEADRSATTILLPSEY